MKRCRASALFFALLLSLSACGGGNSPALSGSSPGDVSQETVQPPKVLPFTLAFYPEYSLHPTLAGNRTNLTLTPLLYESLFTVDTSFQAQPLLCGSYTVSEDKLVWTLNLRPGITFSDGTLGRPNGSLPLLLDIPIALGNGERPAGTGPYVLSEDGLSLTARSGWWQKDKSLPIQSIPLRTVSESDELIYAFDGGEISLVDVDLMATNATGYGGNYQTWDYPAADFLYLGFNTQAGIFRSADARRAVWLAVDRDTIATTIYANHAISTLLPVHPASGLYQPGSESLAYNPEALAAQVEELRLKDSSLVFLVNSENVAKAAAAQLIAYQLETAGLVVELRQLPFEEYTAALTTGAFDLYLGETMFTADFDLAPLLSSAGALNYGGWRGEESDALLAAMQAAAPEEKSVHAGAFFALFSEQAPIVPIIFKNGSVLTQWGQLSGLNPVRGNAFYQIENWSIK